MATVTIDHLEMKEEKANSNFEEFIFSSLMKPIFFFYVIIQLAPLKHCSQYNDPSEVQAELHK